MDPMDAQEKMPEWVLPTYKETDCWNDYATIKVLGKGSYGTTHLAKDKKTGEEVAVKVRWATVVCGCRTPCIHT